MGNLQISRDAAGAFANSIVNRSATLTSDGSMLLAANTVQNIRDVLSVKDSGIYSARIDELSCSTPGTGNLDCDGGKEHHVWKIQQLEKLEVTAASAASSITAGGNMTLAGGDFLNSIAGQRRGVDRYVQQLQQCGRGHRPDRERPHLRLPPYPRR